jgi:hypothetical protein
MKKFLPFSLALVLSACTNAPTAPAASPQPAAPLQPAAQGAPSEQAAQPVAPAAQPAAPAPQSPAALTPLAGQALFRGQPLANYALKVYDAATGQALPVAADAASLAGKPGLIAASAPTTDAKGAFSLSVANWPSGGALRVAAENAQDKTMIAAVVTASAAAKAFRVQQTATLTLDEVSTAIARACDGVLRTTQLLKGESAGPVVDKLLAKFAGYADKLKAESKRLPELANAIVSTRDAQALKDSDATVGALFGNAGLVREVNQAVAEAVSEVASAAKDPAKAAGKGADVQQALQQIAFVGTVLSGSVDLEKGTVTLTNKLTGSSVDASNPNVVSNAVVTTIAVSSGGSFAPAAPAVSQGTLVHNTIELMAAVTAANGAALTVDLANDFSSIGAMDLGTAHLTVNGNGQTIDSALTVQDGGNVTLKNLTVEPRATMPNYRVLRVPFQPTIGISNQGTLTLANVDVTATGVSAVDIIVAGANGKLTMTGGTLRASGNFIGGPNGTGISFDGLGSVSVSGTTFETNFAGIAATAPTEQAPDLHVTNCTFNVDPGPVPPMSPARGIGLMPAPMTTVCTYPGFLDGLLAGNTFGPAVALNRVRLGNITSGPGTFAQVCAND